MALPARILKPRREGRIRCPAHLRFVRSHMCCVTGCDRRPIEAAHVRGGTNGGTSLKPDDSWAVSLCSEHHAEQHRIGEPAFERKYGIDMKGLAREFAAKSPHRAKLAATLERVR